MASLRESLMLTDGGVVSIVGAGGKTSLMFRIARELSQAGESVLTTTTTKILMPDKDQSARVIVSDSLGEFLNKAGMLIKDNPHITAASEVLTAMFDVQSRQDKIDQRRKLIGFEPDFIDAVCRAGVFNWILVEADGAAGKPLKAPDPHEPVIPGSTKKLIAILGLDGVGKPLDSEWVFRPHRFAEITGLSEGDIVKAADCVVSVIHENGIMKGAPGDAARLVFLNKADQPDRVAIARKIAALLEKEKDAGLHRVIIGQAIHEPPVLEFRDLHQSKS
jgi:probable selenium-dependent hydroxylase accessory protein YqeC